MGSYNRDQELAETDIQPVILGNLLDNWSLLMQFSDLL
jgi:hypothetical protein